MREKINAICLSHHAAPQYISARPADRLSLPSLSQTEKLYWGTLSHCPPPARCPPPPASAPLTGPRCDPPLFISTSLISHARISEQSAILINVSCFSAPPVQGITHTHKKKGTRGRPGDERVRPLSPGGAERNGRGRAQTE